MLAGTRRQRPAKSLVKRILPPVFVSLVLGLTSLSGAYRPAVAQGIPELLNRVRPSIGFVFVSGDQFQGSGTGFAVDASGLLITAFHVVENASQVSVTLPGGQPQQAEVMAFDADNDLALLRIGQSNLLPLALGDSDALKAGEEVIVIGYPFADTLGTYDVTITKGIISAIRPETGTAKVPPIQVDAAMNPGVSGGPVLDTSGQVVGIAVSRLLTARASAVNFARPVKAAKVLLVRYLDTQTASAALALPMTSVAPVLLRYKSGGIGLGGHETKLGVSCIEPPQGARTIGRVRAVLDSGPLSVMTWLSLGGEAPADSPNSFARLRAIEQRVTPRPLKTNLPADTVCLNYEALNATGLFGGAFEVKYGLDFRIIPSSDSAKLPEDPAIAEIKAKVTATVRKQLLDLYQHDGLDAVLARLRAPAKGSDVVSQAIYAEHQRLLDVYEFDGRDGLLAELKK